MTHTIEGFDSAEIFYEKIERLLKRAKAKGVSQAEVGLQIGLGQQVSVRRQAVETIEYQRDKSIALTVYMGQQSGSASTNDFSDEALNEALEAAIGLAQLTQADEYAGLAEASSMATVIQDLDLYHPWSLSTEQAIALAMETEKAAFDYDPRIENSEGASVHTGAHYHAYGNSHGFLGGYATARHSSHCVVIAKSDAGMERDYDYTLSRYAQRLLAPALVGESAAKRTLSRLNSRSVPTQKVPILFDTTIAGGLIGHFLSAISGGQLFRRASFLCDSLGKPIFPKGFGIVESPYEIGGLGSTPFDNDGVATLARHLVKDGLVESYVLSAYSARRLGLKNTGNAGGVTNIRATFDAKPLNALLKEMGTGLWVTELMGQGVQLVTGDYSRGAAGFWVEKGEVQFPVSGVTIAGRLQDMFAGIVALGTDIDTRHSIQTGSILVQEMMVAGH